MGDVPRHVRIERAARDEERLIMRPLKRFDGIVGIERVIHMAD